MDHQPFPQGTGKLKLTTSGDREVVMTRVFDAPRRMVFDALTKPELLLRWFAGPPGWVLTTCQFDLRVGGAYRFAWTGPNGEKMGLGGVCLEVNPPERFVTTEVFDEAWYPGEAIVTQTLTEAAGQTTLTLRVRYQSAEALEAVLKTPMEQGVAAAYDKLEILLASLLSEGATKGAANA